MFSLGEQLLDLVLIILISVLVIKTVLLAFDILF